jgi:RNA polymerase sigma-70 factor (ECF subfamily)
MIDELELLRKVARARDVDGSDAEGRARIALQEAILAAGGDDRRRASPWLVAVWPARVGIAVALAAAVLLLAALLRSGSTAGPPPAAAAVLQRLARVAGAQPTLEPRPGQYLYTASHSLTSDTVVPAGGHACELIYTQYRQNWVARDGRGLFTEQNGPRHLAAGAPAACAATLRQIGAAPETSRDWAAPGCLALHTVDFAKLPRDPVKLRARLLTGRVEGGPPGAAEAFIQVADLLRESDAPPALRAALYRAAAGLPAVRSLGTIKDQLGRSGLGLAIDSRGTRQELIFDPATGGLIAEQGIQLGRARNGGTRPGSVLYWTSYDRARVVDHLPQPSPLPLRPRCIQGGSTARTVPGHPDDAVLVGTSFLQTRR